MVVELEPSRFWANVKVNYTKRERLRSLILRVILLTLLVSGATALVRLSIWRSPFVGQDSRTRIVGNLPTRDLAEIRRIALPDPWRKSLPRFSKHYLRDVRAWYSAVRRTLSFRTSEHISEILLQADGTFFVAVNVWDRDLSTVGGWADWLDRSYVLRKGPTGWQIITTWHYEHCRG